MIDFIHNISYSLLHTRNIVEGRTSKLEISYKVLFKYNTRMKSGKFQYECACDKSVHSESGTLEWDAVGHLYSLTNKPLFNLRENPRPKWFLLE